MDNMQWDEVTCRDLEVVCLSSTDTGTQKGMFFNGGAGGRKITAVLGRGVVVFSRDLLFGVREERFCVVELIRGLCAAVPVQPHQVHRQAHRWPFPRVDAHSRSGFNQSNGVWKRRRRREGPRRSRAGVGSESDQMILTLWGGCKFSWGFSESKGP